MNPRLKKILVITLALAVLVVVGYVIYKKRKGKKEEKKDPLQQALDNKGLGSDTGDTKTTKTKNEAELIQEAYSDDIFPLKKNKSGKRVRQLQRYILQEKDANALPTFGVDGLWGTETGGAVQKYFQRDNISKEFFIKKKMYNYGE